MLTVRRAVSSDLDAISQVTAASLRWLGIQEGWTSDRAAAFTEDQTSREGLLRLMERDAWWTAWEDGELVGAVSVFRNAIARLYVQPDRLRRGIGSRLFETAEQHVRGSGYDRLTTKCFATSRPFYVAMGMSPVGRERCDAPFLAGKELFLMGKDLTLGT